MLQTLAFLASDSVNASIMCRCGGVHVLLQLMRTSSRAEVPGKASEVLQALMQHPTGQVSIRHVRVMSVSAGPPLPLHPLQCWYQ